METVVYTVAFHGGAEVVEKPEIRKSPRNLDFGVGFCTTQSREQTARWAERQCKVRGLPASIVNKYDFSGDVLHCQGEANTIADIDDYIANHREAVLCK